MKVIRSEDGQWYAIVAKIRNKWTISFFHDSVDRPLNRLCCKSMEAGIYHAEKFVKNPEGK